MIYHLNMKRGLKRTRQAYNDQALSAQNGGYCVYASDKGPCAVGAMLPKRVVAHLRKEDFLGAAVDELFMKEKLVVDSDDERLDLIGLQNAHDRWANGKSTEAAFERQLTFLEQKYGVTT